MSINFNQILTSLFSAPVSAALTARKNSGGGGGGGTLLMWKPSHRALNLLFYAFALTALTACGGGGSGGGGGSAGNPHAVDPTTGYQPSDTVEPPTGGWAAALDAARSDEYDESGGAADRIGAAYAYARGHTGAVNGDAANPVIVSVMSSPIDLTHADLAGQLTMNGYKADGDVSGMNIATCTGSGVVSAGGCGTADDSASSSLRRVRKWGTRYAAIIAGKSGNFADGGLIQGIAYNAKIKPINIDASGNIVNTAKRTKAIAHASIVNKPACDLITDNAAKMTSPDCKPIAVMYNGWNALTVSTYMDMRTTYYIRTNIDNFFSDSDVFSSDEKDAWVDAVKTTVVVFSAGDVGQNSINGMVRRSVISGTSLVEAPDVAWSSFPDGGGNQASSYARLPVEVMDGDGNLALAGKWLSVIALDRDANGKEIIHKYSNGCGDTMAFCLGAPGVAINSAVPGNGYEEEERRRTAQAAAHVAGAVAVLKGAFPNLEPHELVSLILESADYIPLPVGEVAGSDTNAVYGHGSLNLARATEPMGDMSMSAFGNQRLAGARIDNSGITLPTSFGGALDGFTVGFTDDYNRAYIGNPARITRTNAAFTLGDTIATWESPELKNIQLDSNSKMQFTNYEENSDAKDTLIFTHHLPNHTIGFAYNEESKSPDLNLANAGEELHFQKIRPIASDLMQLNSTYKLGKAWNVKNALTSGEFDTGNRFNEAMANLNYTSENHNLTIGAGTLQEYGQFLGASGTGAYQLSDATSSQVTHLAVTQNLPLHSAIKLKYTGFKTEVDMRYDNFAKINDLTADEYQLSFAKKQILGKHDSLDFELIQPFAITDGKLQQSTVLGYNAEGDYNNVVQNYDLKPANRRQQLRMTWQNQLNLERKTRLFISMQYENNVNNLQDKKDSQILGGISTRF